MKENNCERFFSALAKNWEGPVRILLLGGSAAQIYGGVRPTIDVDFEAVLLDSSNNWEAFEKAVHSTENQTGIAAQFSENIDRWSQISYLDYRDHLRKVKNYNQIQVYLLNPYYWSIGKVTRFLDADIQDMVSVFQKQNIDPLKLGKLWLKALQESPRSTELFITKKNALHFFKSFGKKIWGSSFQEEKVSKIFS